MNTADVQRSVLCLADVRCDRVEALLDRYGLQLQVVADGEPITASFWQEPEAGILGRQVFARADTPLHSLLHEACHVICMTEDRRRHLERDAGGDDLEEAAVCYLQIVLADDLDGVGRARLMHDMDTWGYSFRLGSTAAWFGDDADDARRWLQGEGLLTASGRPVYALRGAGNQRSKAIETVA